MSKYSIEGFPRYKPGKCANCGACKQDGRGYVDFKLEVDWYGIVYLCTICLKDIATAAGLFDDILKQLTEAQTKTDHISAIQAEGEKLHQVVLKTFEEVREHYDNLHSLGDNPPVNPGDTVVIHTETNSGRGTGSTQSGVEEADQRTVKSTSSSGRPNVPSLAELLNSKSTT